MSFFLNPAPSSPALQALLDDDVDQLGFEMNGTHLRDIVPSAVQEVVTWGRAMEGDAAS